MRTAFFRVIEYNAFNEHNLFYVTDSLEMKLIFYIFLQFFGVLEHLFLAFFSHILSFNAHLLIVRCNNLYLVDSEYYTGMKSVQLDKCWKTENCRSTLPA